MGAVTRESSTSDARWGLMHAAGRFMGRRGPARGTGHVYTWRAVHIYRASDFLPYGYANHRRACKTHRVDGVYLAWERGTYRGTMVRWMCGAQSPRYQLTDTPGPYRLCHMCFPLWTPCQMMRPCLTPSPYDT